MTHLEKMETSTPTTASEKTSASMEREKSLERRKNTVLVCPDNDPESRMIQLIAEKMGMSLISSKQAHGAKLDREEHILDRVAESKKSEVWIVEIPGPEIEQVMKEHGLTVHIIDHHAYGKLDRATDQETRQLKNSSLEQFIDEAQVTDEELRAWGLDPKIVKGLGILDGRFAQGLRDEKYTQEEIAKVVDLSTEFSKQITPDFEVIAKSAEDVWRKREDWNGYFLVKSDFPLDIRGAIGYRALREGLDCVPAIISSSSGKKLYLQNADPVIIKQLQKRISSSQSFTFGTGKCWGFDNSKGPDRLTLDQFLNHLEEAIKESTSNRQTAH
jgi:hypothetical protein